MQCRPDTPAAIAILGSGHTGHALAATFSLAGHPTSLISLSPQRRESVNLKQHDGIWVTKNNLSHYCPVHCTDDIATAVASADIIFCTTPAIYHEALIGRLLPLIKNGQTIYFSSYFGASKMRASLNARPELTDITLAESMSAIHAARSPHYGHVEIIALKDEVPVATHPEDRCTSFLRQVKKALPHLR